MPAYDPQLGTEIRETFAEPNWAQWVKLNLEMTKSDGSLLKMEMLRQEDWVLEQIDYQFLDDEDLQNASLSTAANSSRFLKSLPLDVPEVPLRTLFAELHDVRWLMAEVEAESVLVTISLDLPEIGVRGEAVVTGLEPCPAILPGPGKVVLTTFHHASSDLIDLYLSPQPPSGVGAGTLASTSLNVNSAVSTGTAPTQTTLQTSEEALLYPRASRATNIDPSWERIGVTGNHPIWSQDRHDYVAAMDLRVGERLKNLSGDTVWVQQKLPRPGPTPVYNLEVQDEHVYYVGASGVLAHNECDKKGLARDDAVLYRALGGARAGHTAHHLVPVSVAQQHGLKSFFRRAAKEGWDINGAGNGLMVDNLIRHVNHHPRYNAYIAQRIRGYIKKAGGVRNVTGAQAKQYLESLTSDMRRFLNNTNGDINKLFEWIN